MVLLKISECKKYAVLGAYGLNHSKQLFENLKTINEKGYKFWFSHGESAIFKKEDN